MRLSALGTAASAALFALVLTVAQNGQAQTAPDNTAHNKNQKVTADTQSNAKSDLEITAKVRRAIIADSGLSTYAHNVKIITSNGVVTLKGPVNSEEEKQKVGADAAGVTSADAVHNKLTVKK